VRPGSAGAGDGSGDAAGTGVPARGSPARRGPPPGLRGRTGRTREAEG
jgi:hypothetical protein